MGNPLAGDDAVGWHVAHILAADDRLPPDVEVLDGGTDLLRLHHALRHRCRVVLVDAVLSDAPAGTVVRLDPEAPEPPEGSAHQLSPMAAIRLLRAVDPVMAAVPLTLLGVSIPRVCGRKLSPGVAAAVGRVVDRVLLELAGAGQDRATPGR